MLGMKTTGEKIDAIMGRTEGKTPEELQVEDLSRKARRVTKLLEESHMYRRFVATCEPGRYIEEYVSGMGEVKNLHGPLRLTMDPETASMWKDFALRFAAEREAQMKKLLA